MYPRVTLVTGGASGLGARVVERLAAAGARVMVMDLPRQEPVAHALLEGLPDDQALFFPADVREPEAVEAGVRACEERLGLPEGLALAAGLEADFQQTVTWGDMRQLREVFEVNLFGSLHVARALARRLVDEELPGSLVLFSSTAGKRPSAGPYSVAKAAVIMLARTLAAELSAHGIRVNAVSPGYHRTPMMERLAVGEYGAVELGLEQIAQRVPLGRLGTADDVAGSVLFLLSSESSYMTGATLFPDGGIANRDAGG
jgi:NAD(P)-dependent dehydrogenase (short-subunit alcohol dehydrogenase family)